MTSFTEHILSLLPFLSSLHSPFTATPFIPLHPLHRLLFLSAGLPFSRFYPLSCFFSFPLSAQMSPFCPRGWDAVVKSDWGEVIFGLWQEREREGERERSIKQLGDDCMAYFTSANWLTADSQGARWADNISDISLIKISDSFEAACLITTNTHG